MRGELRPRIDPGKFWSQNESVAFMEEQDTTFARRSGNQTRKNLLILTGSSSIARVGEPAVAIRFSRHFRFQLRRLKAGFRTGPFSNRRKRRPWPETLEDRSLLSPITVYPIPDPPQTNVIESVMGRSRGTGWQSLVHRRVARRDWLRHSRRHFHRVLDYGFVQRRVSEHHLRHHSRPFRHPRVQRRVDALNRSAHDRRCCYLHTDPRDLAFPSPYPGQMTALSDGSVWWMEVFDLAIGELTPTGDLRKFKIPSLQPYRGGIGDDSPIIVGPDGNLWFLESYVAKMGMITPDGTITEFALPLGKNGRTGSPPVLMEISG